MYFRTRVQIPAPPFITPFAWGPLSLPHAHCALGLRPRLLPHSVRSAGPLSLPHAHCALGLRPRLLPHSVRSRAPFTSPRSLRARPSASLASSFSSLGGAPSLPHARSQSRRSSLVAVAFKRRRTDIANPKSRAPSSRAPSPRLLCRPIAPEFLGLHAVRTARKHGPIGTHLTSAGNVSTRVFVDHPGRRSPRQPVYHWIP